MSDSKRGRTIVIVVLVLLALLASLLVRCQRAAVKEESVAPPVTATPAELPAPVAVTPEPVIVAPPEPETPEVLTAATVQVPPQVTAGTVFSVHWTGPNNAKDYVTIVGQGAAAGMYANYRETREGPTLELVAPIEPGAYEVRYVANRSKTVLGSAPITVVSAPVTLNAVSEVVLGAKVSVTWKGPDNKDDYITLVPVETADGKYGNFTYTNKGSPLEVTAPVDTGEAELRYMTGQGYKVLARRPIKIVAPEVKLTGPAECVAGSSITVNWTGPNNSGDYITLVSKETRDGQYGNYADTSAGSALKILVPIMAGEAELRYMTGQGAKVLARIPVKILVAKITLSAIEETKVGTTVTVQWTGPNHPGDYITFVPSNLPDGQYRSYANTTAGSPLTVTAPKEAGDAELRYMSGQGSKVLARQSVKVVAN